MLVGVAQARDIEFVANNPGDWHFHCHLPHHMMNQMASMVGPLMMSHANAPGRTVEAGMGIHEGHALGDAAAPPLAAPSTSAPRQNATWPTCPAQLPQTALPRRAGAHRMPACSRLSAGHVMVMDDMVAKPETYGLRPGWTGGTMGMMTIVRVVEPELFDKIQELKAEQARKADAR